MIQNGQIVMAYFKADFVVLSFLLASTGNAQTFGTFTATSSMSTARSGHTATLLSDGRVLIVGGDQTGTAELYDPVTGTFNSTGNMTTGHGGTTTTYNGGAAATLLTDGRVLIAGSTKSELYDPVTGRFAPTGNMVTAQSGFTATLLMNGKVLISGGTSGQLNDCAIAANAELYDPSTGIFSLTGPYAGITTFSNGVSAGNCGAAHAATTLLPNGKVLILAEPAAELYDPTTNTFGPTGSMVSIDEAGIWGKPTEISGRTATLLANGKVLVAGGKPSYFDTGDFPLSHAELYDFSLGIFTATNSMHVVRQGHTATLLPNGTALIMGGRVDNYYDATALAELYDPSTGAFTAVANMQTGRAYHQATLLRDGRVLVTGGIGSTTYPNYQALASAELYTADPWQEAIDRMKASAPTDSLNFWQWAWYWQRAPSFAGAPAGFGVPASIDGTGAIADIITAGGGNGLQSVSAAQWASYYREALAADPWQRAIAVMQASAGTNILNFWQWAWYWQRSPQFAGAPAGFGVLGSIDNTRLSSIIAVGGGEGRALVSAEQWVVYYRQPFTTSLR